MISIASSIEPEISTTTTTDHVIVKSNDVFRSKLPDIAISNHLPLHIYCFENVTEFSDRPCLISGSTEKIYSFVETQSLCRKSAAGLSNLGVKKGDVIMIILQNCVEFVFAFMGASMIGAMSTTANPFYTSSEEVMKEQVLNLKEQETLRLIANKKKVEM